MEKLPTWEHQNTAILCGSKATASRFAFEGKHPHDASKQLTW